MISYYVVCPVCGSRDHESLFPSFYLQDNTTLQTIGICRDCGLVYRNPHIPGICAEQYTGVKFWTDTPGLPAAFSKRWDRVSEEIRRRIPGAKTDLLWLDVGAGPGWLTEQMTNAFSSLKPVLLEPALEVAKYAKQRYPTAVVLPSRLPEADLPRGAFSLITANAVDYLFENHRADLEKISTLLSEDGVFYLERNVFVDQRAYYQHPILDMDDLCGSNAQMNTWFGRGQLGEYLAQFFDVFDQISYIFEVSPEPYLRPCQMNGFFCRKRKGAAEAAKAVIPNRYNEHLQMLRSRAIDSSLEDLRELRVAGIRNVMLGGRLPEVKALAGLIKEHRLFSIAGFGIAGAGADEVASLSAEFASADRSTPVDAFFGAVAGANEQEAFLAAVRAQGFGGVAFPCFRPGLDRFWSDGSTAVQLKAFLPALLRRQQSAARPVAARFGRG